MTQETIQKTQKSKIIIPKFSFQNKKQEFTEIDYYSSARWVYDYGKYIINNKRGEFIIDDELKRIYKLLTLYFTNNKEFENYSLKLNKGGKLKYSLRKGILLIGDTGRSKSFLFNHIFYKFTQFANKQEYYKTLSLNDLSNTVLKYGAKGLNYFQSIYSYDTTHKKYYNLYIDEIGAEAKEVKSYGNILKPLEIILTERHILFEKQGIKTHATSNFLMPEFKDNYDKRVYSRLFEMFNIIITNGKDLRIV